MGRKQSEDLSGKKIGRLTLLKRVTEKGRTCYLCECECEEGTLKIIRADSLIEGKTVSCGCYNKEQARLTSKSNFVTHGKSNTRLYGIYFNMKERCYNEKMNGYNNYGGRGIAICNEWLDNFMNFYSWSINNGYRNDLSIDRIDVNGNYEPSNCRWATRKEQANNKTNSVIIVINGESRTAREWEEEYSLPRGTVWYRYKIFGITGEDLLNQPREYSKNRTNKL